MQEGERGRNSLTVRFAYVMRMEDLKKSKNRDIAIHPQLSKFAREQRVCMSCIHLLPYRTDGVRVVHLLVD